MQRVDTPFFAGQGIIDFDEGVVGVAIVILAFDDAACGDMRREVVFGQDIAELDCLAEHRRRLAAGQHQVQFA